MALVFSETAFKKWLIEKDVLCLKYVSADHNYEDIRTAKYWPTIRKGITSYYFDEDAILEKVKIEEIEISLRDDSLQTENNYNYILKRMFPYMPFALPSEDVRDLVEYTRSEFFPGIKIKFMKLAVSPEGKAFANYQYVDDANAPFDFYYSYQLKHEIYFEDGEINSVKNYSYGGDFYIPYMGITEFEKVNDTLSILKERAHTGCSNQDYCAEDTLITYPYYRKTSEEGKRLEFGVRILDSAEIYCYFPLKEIYIIENDYDKIRSVAQAYDGSHQVMPITIANGYGDYRFLSYGSSIYPYDGVLNRETCDNLANYAYHFRKEKNKTVTKLDKKTNEFSEKKIYSLVNDEWQLNSRETKTETGYLQNYYTPCCKKPVYQIKISSDANSNPVFTKIANEKEEIIFRISGDSIYLTRDENFYGHFFVEYE